MADRNWLLIFRRVVFAVFLGLEICVGWTNYREIEATQYTASGSIAEWERRFGPPNDLFAADTSGLLQRILELQRRSATAESSASI